MGCINRRDLRGTGWDIWIIAANRKNLTTSNHYPKMNLKLVVASFLFCNEAGGKIHDNKAEDYRRSTDSFCRKGL